MFFVLLGLIYQGADFAQMLHKATFINCFIFFE